jgi:AcrR family transcriptional regulator
MTASPNTPHVDERSADAGDGVGLSRPMRADALKNRRRILDAAEATFTTEGLSAPIDAVAARAGVGVGTVYRHFPTKEALFEAIVAARLDELATVTKELAAEDDPEAALFSFLREFARQASAKHDLFDALESSGLDIKSNCAANVEDLTRGIELLLDRAKQAGAVRPQVATDEIMSLIVGACQSGQDDAVCQRMVEIVCDGIRAPAGQSGA